MSGKFTNLIYDKDAYNDEVARSTRPMEYRLDPNFSTNCNTCFAPYGPRGGHDNAVAAGNQIDVDSILRGLTKVHSKANRYQIPDSLDSYKTVAPPRCHSRIDPEYSRHTHPAHQIKGLNVPDLRFHYPLHDPQCNIFEPFAINTRLQAKDNHRTPWQIPLDQSDAFPVEKKTRRNCRVTIDCSEL